MANVITYGTFDLFHVGHLRLLQRMLSLVRKELFTMGSGTPIQAWLNYHDERNMNHKQTEM